MNGTEKPNLILQRIIGQFLNSILKATRQLEQANVKSEDSVKKIGDGYLEMSKVLKVPTERTASNEQP